jgi:rare lipoprotein A
MVTNVDTGQAVEVRVNDRGPFVDARVIDLSYAAARVLGADRMGTIPVRLRVMEVGAPRTAVPIVPVSIPPSPAAPDPTPSTDGLFAVQVGAFSSRARAESLRETLAREGDPATVTEAQVGGDVFFRVRVGPYADRQAARGMAQRLASRGYRSVVVER